MTRHDEHDDPHDAHLLAALRHAPDRDALPPREVSERILAAARAAVRSADETRSPWWQRLGASLAQPPVAAAFGTLAVASLVGVMWSTREPPVPGFTPSAPLADRAEERSVAATPSASMPAEAAAKPQASGVAAAAPQPRPNGKDAAVRPALRARAEAETAAVPDAAASADATPTAPPSAPFSAAAPPPAADAAPPTAVAERRSAHESEPQIQARQQSAAAGRAASAIAPGMASAARMHAADPLAAVDAALAAGARWQGAGWAGGRLHGDAQHAFWVSVKAATQGRWEAVSPLTPSAPWLALAQGGAILWPAGDTLFITVHGQSWRAPVDAARLADWQAQVARW